MIADTVQFLGGRDGARRAAATSSSRAARPQAQDADFGAAADDDIPF